MSAIDQEKEGTFFGPTAAASDINPEHLGDPEVTLESDVIVHTSDRERIHPLDCTSAGHQVISGVKGY